MASSSNPPNASWVTPRRDLVTPDVALARIEELCRAAQEDPQVEALATVVLGIADLVVEPYIVLTEQEAWWVGAWLRDEEEEAA